MSKIFVFSESEGIEIFSDRQELADHYVAERCSLPMGALMIQGNELPRDEKEYLHRSIRSRIKQDQLKFKQIQQEQKALYESALKEALDILPANIAQTLGLIGEDK